MINLYYRIAFIHINKTAGSSIETALGLVHEQSTHMTLKDFSEVIQLPQFYKFSFIRNPYDKIVSQYHHRVQNMKDPIISKISFKDWVKNLDELGYDIKGTGNQVAWLSLQDWEWDVNKQEYTKRPKEVKFGVDFIGFFEQLTSDWKELQQEIGIYPHIKLPHRRKSNHKHYREYYDDTTQEIIYKRFEDDFKIFNYKF